MQETLVWFLGWKDAWSCDRLPTPVFLGFPGGSDSKESACNVGELGFIPGRGRSPRGGHGDPLQYSCLENPHGQRSLAAYNSLWGHKELTTMEQLSTAQRESVSFHERQSDILPKWLFHFTNESSFCFAFLLKIDIGNICNLDIVIDIWDIEWTLFPRQTIQYHGNQSLCSDQPCWRSWSWMVLWRPTRPSRTNTPKNVLFIIEDWNAKVWSRETPGITGKFGLGVQNEAGQRLIEIFQENAQVIANTLFQQHKRILYTWISPDG